jgi:hypothetical protein
MWRSTYLSRTDASDHGHGSRPRGDNLSAAQLSTASRRVAHCVGPAVGRHAQDGPKASRTGEPWRGRRREGMAQPPASRRP